MLMVIGRTSRLNEDGVCMLGLNSFSYVPCPFEVWKNAEPGFAPSMKNNPTCGLRTGSKRVFHRDVSVAVLEIASYEPEVESCGEANALINILIMIGLKGNELGWICLTSCVTDVTINAIFLFWVSGSGGSSRPRECRDRFSLPRMDMTALTMPESVVTATTTQGKSRATTTMVTTVHSPTSMAFTDEMYDYIPKEHRHCIDEEEEGCEGAEARREEGERVEKVEKVEQAGVKVSVSASRPSMDLERGEKEERYHSREQPDLEQP
ncbi:hypothetical protein V5O48_016861 [Marasmius crinis-equi]|uniref:Uncharacterized protein n=1 Tax=Marasmius crinis-equi TaxID=585013 RepID=A0ABR3EQI8_9AGAR